MAGVTIRMECTDREKSIRELAGVLKRELNAELLSESLREVGGGTVLLLSFEKYYFRNGSYASLTVMITEDGYNQTADIVGSGGGEGLLNFSFGANQSFADMAVSTLEEYGYMRI